MGPTEVALGQQKPSNIQPAFTADDAASPAYSWPCSDQQLTVGQVPFLSGWQRDSARLHALARNYLGETKRYLAPETALAVEKAFEQLREEQLQEDIQRRQRLVAVCCKRYIEEAVHNTLLQRAPMLQTEIELLDTLKMQVQLLLEKPWYLTLQLETYV